MVPFLCSDFSPSRGSRVVAFPSLCRGEQANQLNFATSLGVWVLVQIWLFLAGIGQLFGERVVSQWAGTSRRGMD